MEDDMTVLARIISDAIHAYPTDANHQILAFVAGVSDNNDIEIVRRDKDIFMESWSKCVLKSKAFGSREQFNPVAFRQDLIMELTHGNKDASKLNDMSKMFLRDSTTGANSKSLHAMSYIGNRLLVALDNSYHHDSHSSNESNIICHDSAIMFQRQRFRGAKFNWSSPEPAFSRIALATLRLDGIETSEKCRSVCICSGHVISVTTDPSDTISRRSQTREQEGSTAEPVKGLDNL
jgi:hypothetical protein